MVPVYRPRARIGNWRQFLRDPLGLLLAAHRSAGDVVMVPMLYNDAYLVHDPAALRELLVTSPQLFGRGVSHLQLAGLLGRGLLTSELPAWIEQRRAVAPAFAAERSAELAETVIRLLQPWRVVWAEAARRGEDRCLADDLMGHTTQVAVEHFLGQSLDMPTATRFVRDFMRMQADSYHRVVAPWRIDVRAWAARRWFRRWSAELKAQAPLAVRDQVETLLAAGPENPSNMLAWLFYVLGRNLELQTRAAAAAQSGEMLPRARGSDDPRIPVRAAS